MNVPDVPVFLAAYHPLFICMKCLAMVMQRDPTWVTEAINRALAAGHVEAAQESCLNCGTTDTVVRVRRPRPLP